MVALVTALIFFDHLRLYNQILFVYASATMGGFASDSVPDYVNLWDSVFFPVMETLGLTLIGIVPLITMRVFAEERARGTDELLLTTRLTPGQIVLAKFAVTYLFVAADDGGQLPLPRDGDRAGRARARASERRLPGPHAPRHRARLDRAGVLGLHLEPAGGGGLGLGGRRSCSGISPGRAASSASASPGCSTRSRSSRATPALPAAWSRSRT